jgi:hypothetical protein
MPYYKVTYKTDADEDGETWPLGPIPDAHVALAIFNNTYAREKTSVPSRFGKKSPACTSRITIWWSSNNSTGQ